MITEAKETLVHQRPETGWATARRLHRQRIRTCVRATIDGDDTQKRWEDDWNLVRGED